MGGGLGGDVGFYQGGDGSEVGVAGVVKQGVEDGFDRKHGDAGVAEGGEHGGVVFGAAAGDGVA